MRTQKWLALITLEVVVIVVAFTPIQAQVEKTEEPATNNKESQESIIEQGAQRSDYPADALFSRIVSVLIRNGIQIASAIKDAGIITSGAVFIPNINRSDLVLAFRCGVTESSGGLALPCLDFSVKYQFLVQPLGANRSTVMIQPTVVGLDSNGRPRGQIADSSIVEMMRLRMQSVISSALSPP